MSERRIRVLVAKPGLDGHDRGAKVVARALRDAGMEVIYTGIRQTPEMIVESAMQEDVDVIGLSSLSGAHMALFPRITDLLEENSLEHILVVAGGIIPDGDAAALEASGVARVFGPGTSTEDIAAYIRASVADRGTEDGVGAGYAAENRARTVLDEVAGDGTGDEARNEPREDDGGAGS